jgi:hypothetical protein
MRNLKHNMTLYSVVKLQWSVGGGRSLNWKTVGTENMAILCFFLHLLGINPCVARVRLKYIIKIFL